MENEKKKPLKVHLNARRRFFSSLINFVLMLLMAVFLDRMVFSHLLKNTDYYKNQNSTYESLVVEYEKLQDEYGIYYYDEQSSRKETSDVTSETIENFQNDTRVIETYKQISNIQTSLLRYQILIAFISLTASTLILTTFAGIIFKGRSLGGLIYHFRLMNKNGEYLKIGKIILYGFVKWVFYYILGIFSVSIIPIILFKGVIYKENHQSFLDSLMDVEFVVDEEYIAD